MYDQWHFGERSLTKEEAIDPSGIPELKLACVLCVLVTASKSASSIFVYVGRTMALIASTQSWQ